MQRRIGLPGRRERHDEGADGEAAQRTDRLLRRLPERDWEVVADVDPKHRLDHVLVGPGGVFAISSRDPEGVGAARVKDGMLWLRRGGDPRADRPGGSINRDVLDSARALHKEIRSRTARGPEVHPVVVLWCEFPQAVAESDRIAFVRGRDLLDWVSHRPQSLDVPGRHEVAEAVRAIPRERGSIARLRRQPRQRGGAA